MATTRVAWRAALRDAIAVELPDVDVTLIWPGQPGPETVWLESPDGTVEVPYFHGTPSSSNELTYRDSFRQSVQIRCASGGNDEDEAEERVAEIRDAAVKAQRDNPTFDVEGVLFSTLVEENGPATGRDQSVGVVSFLQLVFQVLAQEG